MTYLANRAARPILPLLLLCAMSGFLPHRVVTAGGPARAAIPTVPAVAESVPAPESLFREANQSVGGSHGKVEDAAGLVVNSTELDTHTASPIMGPGLSPKQEVAILFSKGEPRFAEVANQLVLLLPGELYSLTLVDVENEASLRLVRALRGRAGLFVVAIGLPAARVARDELTAPIVFAEVFNYRELIVRGRSIHGVTAMPPLDLQVEDWKRLDPRLRRVGLIVSERYTEFIPPARSAAEGAGLTFESEVSSSDQETLYLFRRLTPRIDGLWLVPDDGILSPAVLGELFEYAVSHGVGVSVFTDALLDWGALLSASGTTDEIAWRTHQILMRMIAGETDSLPRQSPLSEVAVRINLEIADRLGLASPRRESWIVRGQR